MKIVVCLYDTKAEVYMQPFFVSAIGVAVRNLQDEVHKGGDDNVLARHAQDFLLFQLGTYDEESGYIDALQKPNLVCGVSSLVASDSQLGTTQPLFEEGLRPSGRPGNGELR